MDQLEKKKLFDALERNSYNDAFKITEVSEQFRFFFLKKRAFYFKNLNSISDNDSKIRL